MSPYSLLVRLIASAAVVPLLACGDVQVDPDAGADGTRDDYDAMVDTDAGFDAMPEPDPAVLEIDRTSNDFGDVLVGGRSANARFVVRNTGESTSGTLARTVDGDADQFEVSGDCIGTALEANDSCEVVVAFTPSTDGAASATVAIEGEPGGALSIAVSGNALQPGALQLDDASHDFGAVALSATSDSKVFTIENTGGVATGVVSVSVNNADAFSIEVDNCSGEQLDAAETCTIELAFAPTAVGSATGSVTISANPGGNAVASLGGTGQARVTVTRVGTGSGQVTSSPAGIDCGTTCAYDFESPAVSLEATTSAGSVFVGWEDDCTGNGDCDLNLTGTASVAARFEALRALSVAVAGGGSGRVTSVPAGIDCGADCAQDYVHGTSVTLTATPGPNSELDGWTGCPSPNGNQCVVPMTQARSVTATFETIQHTLSVTRQGAGSGTVISAPAGINCGTSCSAIYDQGTSVTLTATAAQGSDVGTWTGCDIASGNSCTVSMGQARNVTISFALENRSLDVTRAGTGTGTVTSTPAGINCGSDCNDSYPYGSSVTLTAQASTGSTFEGWTGCTVTGRTTCTVEMTAARNVTAVFDAVPRTLGVSVSGSGTVTSAPAGISCGRDCTEVYDHGTIVTLTAAPNNGYRLASWTGCNSTSGNECKVELDADKTVRAVFEPIRYTLTTLRTGSGRGTITSSPTGIDCGNSCTHDFNSGTVVTLTASPLSGGTIGTWSGCDSETRTTCVVTMDRARTVSKSFGTVN